MKQKIGVLFSEAYLTKVLTLFAEGECLAGEIFKKMDILNLKIE